MKDKEFIKNKGLYFGLYLSIFPFFYFAFGEGLSLMTYFGIFWLAWAIGVFYLLYIFVRELRNRYDFFTFKQAFKSLFLVSTVGLLVLCTTKIMLWKVLYEDKYIELDQSFYNSILVSSFNYTNQKLEEAFVGGVVGEDEYNDQQDKLNQQQKEFNEAIKDRWKEGLSIRFFLWQLINSLFLFVFINLILAYLLRKKIVI
tara:strand:- start:4995 stop:5594 length:600 start_codon:yes stop_codon:yes gene_type:complete